MIVIIDTIKDFFDSLLNTASAMIWADYLDILILTYIIYKLIKLVRETRAGQLIKGIALLVVVFIICNIFTLKALSFILRQIIDIGLIAIIVMFQPELRRTLERVGRTNVSHLNPFFSNDVNEGLSSQWRTAIDEICAACTELSATTTGALIVIEGKTRLGEQISTGTFLNAKPSKELFGNIFFPKTPLHDGAVIIREGVIIAAACFLPKPEREEFINKKLGSRHRAAIGMSENSDALVIIVSEETGTISVAKNGELTRNYNEDTLKKLLYSELMPEKGIELKLKTNKEPSKRRHKK